MSRPALRQRVFGAVICAFGTVGTMGMTWFLYGGVRAAYFGFSPAEWLFQMGSPVILLILAMAMLPAAFCMGALSRRLRPALRCAAGCFLAGVLWVEVAAGLDEASFVARVNAEPKRFQVSERRWLPDWFGSEFIYDPEYRDDADIGIYVMD